MMFQTFIEIAHGVYSLTQPVGEGGHVHAFLCDDGSGELTLIDTLYDTDAAQILDAILRIGKKPTALRHIALSHAHRSHLGGLGALKRLTGATIYAHPYEAAIIEGHAKVEPASWVPGMPMSAYAPTYIYQYGQNRNLGVLPPVMVDESIGDGDSVGALHVMGAPGHTPGHLGYVWADRDVVFAGDSVATWPVFDTGWPAFNLDPPQNLRTIHKMADLSPETVAVGHGEPIVGRAAEQLRSLTAAK